MLKDIQKGIVVCDYHGEIISKKDGDYRYHSLYKDCEDNVYMFQFSYRGEKYYCDAVKHCKCHPEKTIKGRLFNHRRTPNVNVVARGDGERIVLLMITSKDVACGEELHFNYGCKKDSQSHQDDWM